MAEERKRIQGEKRSCVDYTKEKQHIEPSYRKENRVTF